MNSKLCEELGIEFPLFAFSHCRDVIAEVTNAGGVGVLGAAGHTPETLDIARIASSAAGVRSVTSACYEVAKGAPVSWSGRGAAGGRAARTARLNASIAPSWWATSRWGPVGWRCATAPTT